MAKDYILRRNIIVEIIRERKKCSYSEIKDHLINHSQADQIISFGTYSIRTLQRDILEINASKDFTVKSIKKHGIYFITE